MLVNVMTPYRVNLHTLIADGIPELKLHTLVTHGPADFDWEVSIPESIHATYWSAKDDSPLASTFSHPLREWRKGGRLIRYLSENQIRTVITFGYRYLSYLRTIRHCDRAGLPLFVHSDGNIYGDRNMSPAKRRLKKQIYDWWLRRASGVLSMGELGDQFFMAYGAEKRSLYRVPYTPDYDSFSKVDADRLARFHRKYGLDRERRYLVYSGRLVRHKRVDLLIDAFARIADQRPLWDLLIIGDGVLRDALQDRVPPVLKSRIKWSGFLDRDEPAVAYHASDVLVLPSDLEPWGVVIQEAMAAGLVIVASHVVGAAHEMVQDKLSGRIFPAGNLEQLTHAILDVTDPAKIDTYRVESRKAFERWRQSSKPVYEIRRALRDVGVLGKLSGG
jgi:glycosyltransferase involved in cell wall biosynthesis